MTRQLPEVRMNRIASRCPAFVAALASALSVAGLGAGAALAGHPTKKSARPVPGGSYVGKTATGKHADADVSPDAKQVSAASFTLVCGGQTTQAAMQNMKIKKSKGVYHFSKKGSEALLFMPSDLSESATVTVKGKFAAHHKIKGTFRVQSATCGDSGAIGYTLKLKTS
jgi:hypothetical protein